MSPGPEEEEEEEERELLEGEGSVWGYEEEPPPPCRRKNAPARPTGRRGTPQPTPKRQVGMLSPGIIESPLWDVEVCMPAMTRKCRRIGTPEPQSQIRYTPQPSRMPLHSQPTPMPGVHNMPRVVGPNRCTFKTPEPPSPLTPSGRTNLLQS